MTVESYLDKDIFLDLEVFIGEETLDIDSIRKEKEIILKNPELFITINNVPYYRGKLKVDKDISVIKITKILSPRESDKIKEKYHLGVY